LNGTRIILQFSRGKKKSVIALIRDSCTQPMDKG
jgi:hypothetical protein